MDSLNRKILKIALPAIVTNVTVPLLNLIDMAIVGHLGKTSYIGAIAVGGMLLNTIYWLFAFLRMGTSGVTSQAFGRRDLDETARILIRSLSVGLLISFFLLIFQVPILKLALFFVHPTAEVKALSALYFNILIWGAPAVLGLYSLTGWFIGMQNSRFPLVVAIAQNLTNIIGSLLMVYVAGMKVAGVAWGTLVAQYVGLVLASFFYLLYYKRGYWIRIRNGLWHRKVLSSFFAINGDIFVRTLCLVAVTMFFTSAGAKQGDAILATNTLLMQFFMFFSFFMDGFAYAGEALSGKYLGAGNQRDFWAAAYRLLRWGLVLAIFFSILYMAGGKIFLSFLTDDTNILSEASVYLPWIWFVPLVSVAAFLWDGIFIGATATRLMLLSMAGSTALFFALYFCFRLRMGNHALWMSFIFYLVLRGSAQTILAKRLFK